MRIIGFVKNCAAKIQKINEKNKFLDKKILKNKQFR